MSASLASARVFPESATCARRPNLESYRDKGRSCHRPYRTSTKSWRTPPRFALQTYTSLHTRSCNIWLLSPLECLVVGSARACACIDNFSQNTYAWRSGEGQGRGRQWTRVSAPQQIRLGSLC